MNNDDTRVFELNSTCDEEAIKKTFELINNMDQKTANHFYSYCYHLENPVDISLDPHTGKKLPLLKDYLADKLKAKLASKKKSRTRK